MYVCIICIYVCLYYVFACIFVFMCMYLYMYVLEHLYSTFQELVRGAETQLSHGSEKVHLEGLAFTVLVVNDELILGRMYE